MPCTQCATRDGNVLCQTCAPALSSPSSRCAGCNAETWNTAPCNDCVTCDRCGNTVPDSDTVSTATGSTICDECRDNWFWRCQGCDEWNPDDRSRCANDYRGPDDCDCDDCRDAEDDDDRGGLVHDYDYKPQPVFHGTGPLFLGPEIEIETPHRGDWRCAEMANLHLGGLGYLKNDSSINSGFEIVTHPMSYQWAMDNFPWQMLTDLQHRECHASDETGIHVHVSRAGFSGASHTYRWMKFIYRNQRQVTTLARRSSPEYAAFTEDDRKAVKEYAKGAIGQRCRAINTGNDDTFELRIFASSLDPDEVKAALGFAAASVEYTRNLTVGQIAHGAGWTWEAFVAWLDGRPTYAPLTRQLEALACVS
jgi:hypothetical protein